MKVDNLLLRTNNLLIFSKAATMLNTFPRSGPLSTAGYAPPTSSGIIALTPLTGFLDTRWQRAALEAAERARAATLTSPGCILKAKAVDGLLGSLFPNADAASLRGFGASGAALDPIALSRMLAATDGSLGQTISNLAASVTLQSLMSGLGRVISSSAGGVATLLGLALAAADGDRYLSLAERLVASTGRTLDVFADAVQRSAVGQFAMGQIGVGDLLSGVTGAMGRALEGVGVVVAGGLHALANVGATGLALAGELLDAGVDALIAPVMALNDLAARLPSLAAAIPGGIANLGRALVGMASSALQALGSAVESALGGLGAALGGAVGRLQGLLSGALKTFERIQLANVIDGSIFELGRELARLARSIFGFASDDPRRLGDTQSNDAVSTLVAAALGRRVPLFGSEPLLGGHGYGDEGFRSFMGGAFSTLADACAFNAALAAALAALRRGGLNAAALDELFASLECRRSTYDRFSLTLGDWAGVADGLLQRLLGLRTLLGTEWLPPGCGTGQGVIGGCA